MGRIQTLKAVRISVALASAAAMLMLMLMLILMTAGCSSDTTDKNPGVPVQIVAVEKSVLQQKVTADAVLFPLNQSAIVPKISAPVKAFLVNRGSHVHKGQVLAVLETRYLAAAAEENKGSYTQAEAAYETTTAADVPQEMQKAQLDAQSAKQLLDAQQKIFNSRQELLQQGAIPRKEVDQAGVDLTNARNQYEI
ncbi:MAG TPA: biotin/lipoyl-binding protein, partial [Terriglobales bacterium]